MPKTLYLIPAGIASPMECLLNGYVAKPNWDNYYPPSTHFDRIDDSHYPPGADAFPGIEELRMRVKGFQRETLYLLPESGPVPPGVQGPEDIYLRGGTSTGTWKVSFARINDSHYPPGADAFPGIEELRARVRGTVGHVVEKLKADDAFLKEHGASWGRGYVGECEWCETEGVTVCDDDGDVYCDVECFRRYVNEEEAEDDSDPDDAFLKEYGASIVETEEGYCTWCCSDIDVSVKEDGDETYYCDTVCFREQVKNTMREFASTPKLTPEQLLQAVLLTRHDPARPIPLTPRTPEVYTPSEADIAACKAGEVRLRDTWPRSRARPA